jgi:uncharacterized membrane protein
LRASEIARRRTEEEGAEAFFPLRATTTAADSKRDARAAANQKETEMAVDTFVVYVGVYPSVEDAEADYQLVKDLHTKAGMLDAYDAAVIEKRENGKVRITKKHETPTRVGGVLGGGVGLATGLVVALFPFAAIGGGLLAATTAGGAVLGAVSGHAAAGMSRSDLKELGEYLDEGEAGLVVVGVQEMEDDIKQSMSKAEKVETREIKADTAEIEQDAKAAGGEQAVEDADTED